MLQKKPTVCKVIKNCGKGRKMLKTTSSPFLAEIPSLCVAKTNYCGVTVKFKAKKQNFRLVQILNIHILLFECG